MKAIAWRPKDQLDIREINSINCHIDWNPAIDFFAEYAEIHEVQERVQQL